MPLVIEHRVDGLECPNCKGYDFSVTVSGSDVTDAGDGSLVIIMRASDATCAQCGLVVEFGGDWPDAQHVSFGDTPTDG